MGVAAFAERDLLRICVARLGADFFETRDLIGLGALCSLDDVELNLIALFETLISLTLDGAVMNEDVSPAVTA
jgi:hypothetical protein